MKIGVKVMPRNEVLDSQGRAVLGTLNTHGHALSACRVGKYIEIEIPETDAQKAKEKAKKMAEFLLCNPLIEKFDVEVL